MNIFFTSDEHYGHDNHNGGIIRMCNRPYANLDEMHEDFIAKHNAKVPNANDSLTIHLGDMFWKRLSTHDCMDIVRRLNGRHAYIWGNHEEVFNRPDSYTLRLYFQDAAEVRMLKVGKQLIWLSHYAHRVWPKSHSGSYHVYAHSHGVLPGYRRSTDVGVDANGYTPISFDEIDAKMKALGTLPPDEIERDMINHPWPSKGEGQ
jgi:calcineurin-like phosphoesterase family protein